MYRVGVVRGLESVLNNTRQASFASVYDYGHIMLKLAGYYLTTKESLVVKFCAMIVGLRGCIESLIVLILSWYE